MKEKTYLLRQINFGKKGELSREITEALIKKIGKTGFSKLIRDLLTSEYSTKKEFKQAKINRIIERRKNLKNQIPLISKELLDLEKQLGKLGYKLKGLE